MPTINTFATNDVGPISDNFSACFLIPCYNHGSTMHQVLQQLAPYGYTCIIVNDGSNSITTEQLTILAQTYTWVTLVTLPKNQGKGAAVMIGLKKAQQQGFTHVLQVDADGQHNLADIDRLLDEAKQYPDCLISGQPIYDESVPKSRYYSRYITHVWVWIETLSLSIKDSMCGFRVYPVQSTIKVIEQYNIGKRMDFDTEILVRLYWHGVNSRFIPTPVIYPENGISHFKAFKDNIKISWMHTKLFFGMLPRIPYLLQRNKKNGHTTPQAHWSETKERSGLWGIKFILLTYRILGRRIANLIMLPVITYFWLTGTAQRKASQQYLKQLKSYSQKTDNAIPWVAENKLTSFRHFYRFGDAMLDKLAGWQGDIKLSDLYYANKAQCQEYVEQKSGTLLIGSHLGDLELCRALVELSNNIVVNALVFTHHAARFNQVMQQVNPKSTVNLIQVNNLGPDTAILLKQKIEAGEWVAIVGDRTSLNPHQRTAEESVVWTDFLGKPAPFPKGPFILASLLACPVFLIWGLKPNGRFQFYMEHFSNQVALPRENRQAVLAAIIQRYAQRLEHYCLISPLDWFNFYDFWQLAKPIQTKPTQPSGVHDEK